MGLPIKEKIINVVIRLMMTADYIRYCMPFLSAANKPKLTQEKCIKEILRKNQKSKFGRHHKFDSIRSYEDFISKVPVHHYEELRSWIEDEQNTGIPSLTEAEPVMYARTSGTADQPKDIPIVQQGLMEQKIQQKMATVFQYRACPEAFFGQILAITSPAVEGICKNGKPYGSTSGLVNKSTPHLVKDKYVIPHEVLSLEDYTTKYLLILRFALAYENITYMGSANPSTFLRLLALFNEHRDELLHDLEAGTFFMSEKIPADVWDLIKTKLSTLPERANQIRALAEKEIGYKHLWPNLKMVMTWTGGSVSVALKSLQQKLGEQVKIVELGYVATEFRGALTLSDKSRAGLPTIKDNFFEFVEKQEWDSDEPAYRTLEQLKEGKEYYVIVTTVNGLYRYFINDLVTVSGFYKKTPLLIFTQKGKGVTNLTGEKLYETQVLNAFNQIAEEAAITSQFYIMLADQERLQYQLYMECSDSSNITIPELSASMDEALQIQNIEYKQKRASGRLQSLNIKLLRPGTGDTYKEFCIASGQRESQFKAVILDYLQQFPFDFEQYLLS